MWLDRLSGHNNSNNQIQQSSRPHSPAPPRRPSHLAALGVARQSSFTPRSSSLFLVNNDSSTSLLSNSNKSAGSNLKQSTTVSTYPEPIEVLDKLLATDKPIVNNGKGQNGTTTGQTIQSGAGAIDDLSSLDFNGLSLFELARSDDPVPAKTLTYKAQTLEDYDKSKARFDDLHKSIRACNDVLHSVQQNLTSFQNDLGAVSAEIETLQTRSTLLNVRLHNRKLVEKGLGPVVEDITLSPTIVKKIVEGAIDETWVHALGEVEKRSRALKSQSDEHQGVKGLNDLKPLLAVLITKALERIRDHLVAQIKALRSPHINAQVIQQQHFLRYKDLYAFLYRHHSELAEQISQAYMNTMRWYYLNQFSRYLKALEKVKLHTLDKNALLGSDDSARKTGSILSSAKQAAPSYDAFNLGRRIDLLKNASQGALPSFLAEEDSTMHYLEYPFRHFNLAMVDNASAEYSFLTSFFSPSLTFSRINKNFNYIFEPTFALGYNLTKSLTFESYDCLGILLCVRLNQHLAFELQRRKIPAVDGYINGTSMLLWPRLQVVMDLHCASLRQAAGQAPKPPTSKAEQAKQSAAPHFLTQRFAQFLHGLLALSTEAGDDEPVSSSLARLRIEMEGLLGKLSNSIGDVRKRERFLFNNYSLILTIIGDVTGGMAQDMKEQLEALKGPET